MRLIESSPVANQPACGMEMSRWQIALSRMRGSVIRLRRRLPYLIWWDDELDVTVTLSQDKLLMIETNDPSEAMRPLFSGAFAEIERTFREMGITFDKGMGYEGRDWEWDWSLEGPISIRFRGRATKPERRRERPRPALAVSNPKPAA